jgi:hypothetical protein
MYTGYFTSVLALYIIGAGYLVNIQTTGYRNLSVLYAIEEINLAAKRRKEKNIPTTRPRGSRSKCKYDLLNNANIKNNYQFTSAFKTLQITLTVTTNYI